MQGQADFYRVEMPSYVGPTIHVCRYPVEEPRPVLEEMVVPFQRREPWLPGALAVESLLLPEGLAGRRWSLLPTGIAAGLTPLWADDSESPLLVPASFLDDRRFDLEWRARVLLTPGAAGVVTSAEVIADVAWAVLCRADPLAVVELLCRLSCYVDRFRWGTDHLTQVVKLMQPPPALVGPLLAAARGGQPILHPRGVRWVLREIVAVSDDERAERAAWTPMGLDERSLLGRAWFPCLRSNRPAGVGEVLLATWMLHEGFHGAQVEDDDLGRLMSLTTALGFRFGWAGSWLHILDRWLAIWSIPDTHPSVATSPLLPSELRSRYGASLGVDVEGWLSGVWALCIRWWLSLDGSHSVSGNPDELFRLMYGEEVIELGDPFRAAFRRHVVQTVDDFAAAARNEGPSAYSGLGSLPQSDSVACRNRPVLETPGGSLITMSVELVAERAVVLHRLLLGARTPAAAAFGKLFEAYISNVLDRLRQRHAVVTEAELSSVLGTGPRCDGLLAYGRDYLAIETSVQTLSRQVARGEFAAIMTMANRYQDEADQALKTIARLPDLAAGLGLPTAERATHLVVTETAVPHSPAFLRKLHELRPERTSKFVCSAEDLEMLVNLGVAGWSVPGAVFAWQGKSAEIPLNVHLQEMMSILSPAREPRTQAEDWVALLPRRPAVAA